MENEIDLWTAAPHLDGRQLRLEPISLDHLDDLEENLLVSESWHVIHWGTRTREDLRKGILNSIENRKKGLASGFAFVLKQEARAVGMSRFMNFNRTHSCLEVGGTWIGDSWQKTFVNTEAKLLMLTYAFEKLRCQRVELRADSLNFNSQRGILRLGAKYEGELRHSCRLPDGRKRDYRMYSILEDEWSNVKRTLNQYLDRYV